MKENVYLPNALRVKLNSFTVLIPFQASRRYAPTKLSLNIFTVSVDLSPSWEMLNLSSDELIAPQMSFVRFVKYHWKCTDLG